MKKLKIILGIVGLLAFWNLNANAIDGCRIGNNLYTSQNGSGSGITYYNTIPVTNANGYCLRTGTTTTLCKTRVWFIVWIEVDSGTRGDYGPSNPPAYCPIDDYIPFILLATGGLGFFYLRRKNKPISVIQ